MGRRSRSETPPRFGRVDLIPPCPLADRGPSFRAPRLICLQRHGTTGLPQFGAEVSPRAGSIYPIGSFNTDIADLRNASVQAHTFVMIDRTSKFAFIEYMRKATRQSSRDLEALRQRR